MRNKDITIRRLVQSVYNMVGDALIKCQQRSFVWLNTNIQSSHGRNLTSPAAGRIDEYLTANLIFASGQAFPDLDAIHPAILLQNSDNLRIGLKPSAIPFRGIHILPGHAKPINRGIRDQIG